MLQPIITLVTDFGQKDHYVGVMKGVILGINRSARLVDICHEIPAQDVRAAAYVLFASYRHFPKDTIHCAVVDPGVGSERKALILKTDRHLFVGPDNGIFSMICNQEKEIKAYSIHTSKDLFSEISSTFHGRDVFAPVSAYLSTGRACSELGKPVSKFVRINTLRPDTEGSVMKGAIACAGCPMSQFTLVNFVEATLKDKVPGVKQVVATDDAKARFEELLRR